MTCKWSQARDFYVSFITPRLRRRKNIYYSPCQTEIKAGYVMSVTHNSLGVIITLLDHSMPIRLVCKQCWVRWWLKHKYKICVKKFFIWQNEIRKIISQCFYFFIQEYCSASCGKCGTLIDKDNISAVVIILLYHDRACVVAAINRITIQPKAGNAAYHTGGEPALLCPNLSKSPFKVSLVASYSVFTQTFITFSITLSLSYVLFDMVCSQRFSHQQ